MSLNEVDYFNRLQPPYIPRDTSFVSSEDDEDTEMRADDHFPYSDSDIYERRNSIPMFGKDEDEDDEDDEDDDDDDDDDEDSDRDHSEVEYGNGPMSLTGSAVISFHQGESTDFVATTRGYVDDRDRSLYTHSETDVIPNNITPRRINTRMRERTPTPYREDSDDEDFGSHRRHDIYASMLSEHANLDTARSDNGPSRIPPKRRREDQAEEEASSNCDSQNSSSSTTSYETSPSIFHRTENLQISRSPLPMALSEHDELNNNDSGGSGPRSYRHYMENNVSPSMDQPPRKRGRSNEGQVIDRTPCQTRSGIYIGTDSPSTSPTVNSNPVVDLTTPASVITISSTLSPFPENLSPYSAREGRIEHRFHSSSSPLTTRSRYANIINDIETHFSDDPITETDRVGSSDEERFRRQEEEMDRLSLNNHRPVPPRNSSDGGSIRPQNSSISISGSSSHSPSSSSSSPYHHMRRISSSSLAELSREIRREHEDMFSSTHPPLHAVLSRNSSRGEEYPDGASTPYRRRPSNEIERSNFMSMAARVRRTRSVTAGMADNQSNENFVRYDIFSDTLDRVYSDRNRNNNISNHYNNHNNRDNNNYNHHHNSVDRHDNPIGLSQPNGRSERPRLPLDVDDEHPQPRSSISPYRSSHRPRSPPGLFSNRMQVRSRPRVSSPPSYWNPPEERPTASRDRERLRRFGDLHLSPLPIRDEYRMGNQREDSGSSLSAVSRNGNTTSTVDHDEREVSDEEVARRLQAEEYHSHFRRNISVMESPMYTPVLTDFLPDLDETSGLESPPPLPDTNSGGPATRTRSSGVPPTLSLPPIDNPSRRQFPLLPPVPRRPRRIGDPEANRSNRINNFMDVPDEEGWRNRLIASGSGSSHSRTRNSSAFASSSSSSSLSSNVTAPPSAPTFPSRARAARYTTPGEISSGAARSRSGHGSRHPLIRFQPPALPYYGNGFASLYGDLSFLPGMYNSYGLASNPDNYMDDDEFDSSYEGLLRLSEQIGDAKPKGVPESIVKALPTKTWAEFKASKEMMNVNRKMKKKAEEGDEDLNRCTICLTEYEDQDILRFLLCQHEYHQNCIAIWLQDNDNCPICRQKIIPEKD